MAQTFHKYVETVSLPIICLCEPGAPCITSWPGPLAGVLQLGHLSTVRRIPAMRTRATAPERFLMHNLPPKQGVPTALFERGGVLRVSRETFQQPKKLYNRMK